MPFVEIDVKKKIEQLRATDPEFKEAWDSSRMEYAILGELNKLRKQKGITQRFIAEKTGIKQQVISRIEKRESSPTLKTLCALADTLDVDIRLVPRHQ
jgi:DNA-binding XRE family transcriptional regulator